MTSTANRTGRARRVYFHSPSAPAATVVRPSVFVAVRSATGDLLLVRRLDSGAWELPGGQVEVGEDVTGTAVRETAEESGVQVAVTGIVGVFTDPGLVVRSTTGEVRQQFAVILRGRPVAGRPHGDMQETVEAAWFSPSDLPGLHIEPHTLDWILCGLDQTGPPHLG